MRKPRRDLIAADVVPCFTRIPPCRSSKQTGRVVQDRFLGIRVLLHRSNIGRSSSLPQHDHSAIDEADDSVPEWRQVEGRLKAAETLGANDEELGICRRIGGYFCVCQSGLRG
jgi:hypothetical protein